MFNKDFYPTPNEVILQMLSGHDFTDKLVLEPSAGKGNIVDYLKNVGADVTVCELDNDLAEITKNKARFLKNDFLEVTKEESSHFDFIIMNPPFSHDDKHIIHAWEIAPEGCTIISLCNWETVDNSYSRSRRVLERLIKENGTKQNLGDCFSDAERKTGVEVGLITLFRPGSKKDFGDYFDMGADEIEEQSEGLMPYNAVREVVGRYVESVKIYDEVLANAVRLNEMAGALGVSKVAFTCTVDEKPSKKEEFVKGLQKEGWKWIFSKMNMGKFMTKSLKEDINRFVETQSNVPFTMKNIYKMIDLVIQTHGQRMDKAIEEVFDKLTMHYHDNRYQVEGWKTNSHYLVNKKFILEYVTEVGWHGEMKIRYGGNGEKMDDMVKALSYLTGEDHASKFMHTDFERDNGKIEFGKWHDYTFFEAKGYKKGTMHFKFKDENVWGRFNRKVAEIKGFPLPEKI